MDDVMICIVSVVALAHYWLVEGGPSAYASSFLSWPLQNLEGLIGKFYSPVYKKLDIDVIIELF